MAWKGDLEARLSSRSLFNAPKLDTESGGWKAAVSDENTTARCEIRVR